MQRLPDHGVARLDICPQRDQPAADLLHRLRRQQSLLVERALGHGEQRRVLQSPRGEHAREVAAHLGDRIRWGAVEDDRDRGAAVGGLLQEAPGHLVGVAGGGGDEQPQVRGGEQLRRQAAVALLDRVDVGGVQQRQALRDRRRGDQLDRARVGGRAVGALELGKDALLVEPRRVVGMVDEHGRTRRRPEYAGLADLLADQRVHQRRLAGTRRPADDREQRSVDLHQPGQHVVLELVDHLRARMPALLDAGDLERQSGVLERLAQRRQGGQHLRGAVGDRLDLAEWLHRRRSGVRHRRAPDP